MKCGVWRVQCEVWGVKNAVWSLECEGSSEKWEVWSVDCEVWNVKCGVWSVKCGLGRVQCEVRSVECEVWSVQCGVWRVQGEVWRAKWSFKRDMWNRTPLSQSARTHGLGWRTAHASSIDEKGFIYIYIFKATSAPPRAGTTGRCYIRTSLASPILHHSPWCHRWNPPTFTKCGSCLPWSSWKKTFRPVDDWRRPWISLVSWGCASWCTRTPWC